MRAIAAAVLASALAVLAVAAPAPAAAQGSRPRGVAQQAGGARNVAALQSLVATRDAEGIENYVFGFAGSGRSNDEPLPEGIESIVLAHFSDPLIGVKVAAFLNHGTYRSRSLFELLLAMIQDHLATGRQFPGYGNLAALLVKTRQPGVEAKVHEVFARGCSNLSPAGPRPESVYQCDPMARFLVGRKHEPTREWLAGQLARVPVEYAAFQYANVDWLVESIGGYGDRRSAEILLAWLESVAAKASLDSTYRRAMPVIAALRHINHAVPVDYDRIRRALAGLPPSQLVRPMTDLIAGRQDARGAEMLVSFLDLPPDAWWSAEEIARALRKLESPEAWRSAQAQLRDLEKRGALKAAQKEALRTLDQLVVQADQEPERQRQHQQAQEATQRLGANAAPLIEARRLAATDPERAGKLYRRVIDEAMERVRRSPGTGGKNEYRVLWPTILEAAAHDRYRRRNPRAAVELLRLLVKLSGDLSWETHVALLHWRMADILHFDLGDRSGAAREMATEASKARASLGRAERGDAGFHLQGLAEWMDAEAAFLRDGKAMHGRPSDRIRQAVHYLVIGDAGRLTVPPPLQGLVQEGLIAELTTSPQYRSSVRAALGGLQPSRENVSRGMTWIGLFRDEASIRGFFDKHDPAGVVTLALLEVIVALDRAGACESGASATRLSSTPYPGLCDDLSRPHPAQEAARKILASRGIGGAASAGSPLATPESAWATFIAALRAGDRQGALACMTPELRDRHQAVLQSLDAARMRAMADEFSPLVMGQSMGLFREAAVTRDRGGKKQAALVYFLRQGHEWRINEM